MARSRAAAPRHRLGWGLVDQVVASGANFAVSLLAARVGGASTLGVVSIGFSFYVLVVALSRALITEPLVVSTAAAAASRSDTVRDTRRALTAALSLGIAASALALAIGLAVPGIIGRGTLLFAPWILPAVVQEFWRGVHFRDGRGARAATNDGARLAAMAVFAPVALLSHSPEAVVATWGLGVLVGAAFGFAQTGSRPAALSGAVRWSRAELRLLGGALTLAQGISVAGTQVVMVLLAIVLAPHELGGLSAVESVFAANTLLAQALALPGLPRVAAALERSYRQARRQAATLSGWTLLLLLPYLAALLLVGNSLLAVVFGSEFTSFSHLLTPIACGQAILAASTGFAMLARADRRRVPLVLSRVVAVVAQMALVVPLSHHWGVLGAAWALAAGSSLGACVIIAGAATARRSTAPPAEEVTTARMGEVARA